MEIVGLMYMCEASFSGISDGVTRQVSEDLKPLKPLKRQGGPCLFSPGFLSLTK